MIKEIQLFGENEDKVCYLTDRRDYSPLKKKWFLGYIYSSGILWSIEENLFIYELL